MVEISIPLLSSLKENACVSTEHLILKSINHQHTGMVQYWLISLSNSAHTKQTDIKYKFRMKKAQLKILTAFRQGKNDNVITPHLLNHLDGTRIAKT